MREGGTEVGAGRGGETDRPKKKKKATSASQTQTGLFLKSWCQVYWKGKVRGHPQRENMFHLSNFFL